MNLMDAILNRRSIRKYEKNFTIPTDDMIQILRAGMYAPTAMHRSPWEFIVVQESLGLNKIKKLHPYASFAREAGNAIVVCEDINKSYNEMGLTDVSMASQNMMLSAYELGYGSCYCGVFPLYKGIFEKIFKMPANMRVIGIIVLGKPAQEVITDERFDMRKIHREEW